MKKLWQWIGVATYWLAWPGLWLIIHGSTRTRLVLICGDEFLLLRGWLGSKEWSLPGGGLHKNETPLDGLLREVREETGITLSPSQVEPAIEASASVHGITFNYKAFVTIIPNRPAVKQSRLEVAAIEWQSIKKPSRPLTSDTIAILAWWQNQL